MLARLLYGGGLALVACQLFAQGHVCGPGCSGRDTLKRFRPPTDATVDQRRLPPDPATVSAASTRRLSWGLPDAQTATATLGIAAPANVPQATDERLEYLTKDRYGSSNITLKQPSSIVPILLPSDSPQLRDNRSAVARAPPTSKSDNLKD